MRKKNLFVAAVCSAVAFACMIAGACSAGKETIDGELKNYDWVYEQEFTDECDVFMTIDGKNDEEIWRDKIFFSHTEYREDKQIALRMTTAFTQKGVYIYGEADDSAVEYNGRFTMTKNSGFTVLVAAEGVNHRWPMECLRFDLDARDCRSWGQSHVTGKTTVEGEIGSQKTVKMTMEMFVSWKTLLDKTDESVNALLGENGDLKDGVLPKRIKLYPKYRQIVRKGDSQAIYKIYPTFTDKEWVALYPYFDADGYTQGEREDSVLGNAQNGLSKTCGWDLKGETEKDGVKSIVSDGRDSQAIYFKNVFAENFCVEATVTPGEPLSTLAGVAQNGQFGLIAQKSFTEFRALHLKTLSGGTGFLSQKGEIVLSGMTYYPARAYTPSWGIAPTVTKTDVGMNAGDKSVKLKLLKIGGHLAFFVNDVLMYQEYQSYLESACAPGLYTYYNRATFSGYRAEAIDESKVDGYLAELGLSRIEIRGKDGQPLTAGGRVTADKFFYAAEENVTLSLKPDTGYVLSEFIVDGEDRYDELCETITFGKYTIDRKGARNGRISVTVDYEYIVRKATRKTVFGNVSLDIPEQFGGVRSLSNVVVHISAAENPQMYFDVVSDANGSFSIDLCVAGTPLPKNRAVGTEGDNYELLFVHKGKTYAKTIFVDDDSDENTATDFLLGDREEFSSVASASDAITVENNVWTYGAAPDSDGKPHFNWLATPDEGKTFDSKKFDGFMFALDTRSVPQDKELRFDFELRNTNNAFYRPRLVYAIAENGTVARPYSLTLYEKDPSTGYIRLPSGFNGMIVCLFEDFTRGSGALSSDNGQNMKGRIWILADNAGLNGITFTKGDCVFVDYAKAIVESYGRIIADPVSAAAHITAKDGVYTFTSSYGGTEWLLAGDKISFDHTPYDALTFDIDTTGANEKKIKLALMFKDGNQEKNTRASVVYAISQVGAVLRLEYRKYDGYDNKQIAIPANFKGKIVVLFTDINYSDETHTTATSVEKWKSLCSAVWIPVAGLDMDGVVFKMSDFTFITNGNELVKGENK